MHLNTSSAPPAEWIKLSNQAIDLVAFFKSLPTYLNEFPFNQQDTFSSSPVLMGEQKLADLKRLSEVLNDSLQAIVKHYFNDSRIREIFQLDPQLESILALADGQPYSVGMYRPDFVYDQAGQAKICEIGCRYPINGWMISYYVNQAMAQLNRHSTSGFHTISTQTDLVQTLGNGFTKEEVVFWVHENEPGTEIKYLIEEFERIGVSVISVRPNELRAHNQCLRAKGYESDQFILELDREELKQLDHDVLTVMIKSEACINDVRSLILVHDKRVLAALYDQDIMLDYMPSDDYAFLKGFLIPSFALNTTQNREGSIKAEDNWILKKSSGGRGVGMLVKSDCPSQQWEQTIRDEHSNYMVQRYVDQRVFELRHMGKVLQIHLVGLSLFYNAESFGLGVFRGSTESVINLHQGRGLVLPCAIEPSF